MDLSKLKLTDWLVGGGGLVYLISMFLPWYTIDFEFVSGSANGFDYGLFGWLPLLLIIAVFVFTVLPNLTGASLPEQIGPLPRAQAALIGAAVAAALVLLRLLLKDDGGAGGLADDIIKRGFGLFLALLAAIAVLAGAFLKFQGKEDLGSGPSPSGPPTPF